MIYIIMVILIIFDDSDQDNYDQTSLSKNNIARTLIAKLLN